MVDMMSGTENFMSSVQRDTSLSKPYLFVRQTVYPFRSSSSSFHLSRLLHPFTFEHPPIPTLQLKPSLTRTLIAISSSPRSFHSRCVRLNDGQAKRASRASVTQYVSHRVELIVSK